MTEIPNWWMKGDWFDACSCNVPCPCTFAQAPTGNHCEGIMAYHIREGAFGSVRLDDLAYWQAEIPGRVKAFAEALSGPTTPAGARVQLHNAPGSEVDPGQIATWARASDNEVDAFGFRWNWAGQSSKHIPFDWTGPV
ncbi:DUF1326 domain-containing protein [Methylocaldum sp. GT1TLB]|uniref:DUF1326 domain-containing protein n=1 Tax=Methylocaldum sp. GT1TLB TaxID=3438965 RepID=UPI003DA07DE5